MIDYKVICFICGGKYTFYSHYVGDQSMCGECRAEEQRIMENPTEFERQKQARKRTEFFQNKWTTEL